MSNKEFNSNIPSPAMQRERSSLGSLNDASTEQTVVRNDSFPSYTHNVAAEYTNSDVNNVSTYLNTVRQVQNSSGWNMGESGSSGTRNRQDGSSNDITVGRANLNQSSGDVAYPSLLIRSGSNHTSPGNQNMSVEVGENSNDSWQVARENTRGPSSANDGYFQDENYSLESSRLTGKRKAVGGHTGQSSSGWSSSNQPREGNGWRPWRGGSNVTARASSIPSEDLTVSIQERVNMRSGPSGGGNTSGNALPLNLSLTESARRSIVLNAPPLRSIIRPNRGFQNNSSPITYSQMLRPLRHFLAVTRPESFRGGSNSRAGSSLGFVERIVREDEETNTNRLRQNIPQTTTSLPTGEASLNYSSQLLPHWALSRENVSRSDPPVPELNGIPQRNPNRYSRGLSQYIRRASPESEGQNSNSPFQTGWPLQQVSTELERAPRGTNLLRSAADGLEERRRIVPVIRSVSDRMRRGEGLQIEMVDFHDRRRDMRLDVDNMPYEELLGLEERMGGVNTGLSDETIENQLKHRKFVSEPCCICQENYNDGDDIGAVDCGHEFHSGCIKQWLKLKNWCPLCKKPALKKK